MNRQDAMNKGLESFMPASKEWLLQRGYIQRNEAVDEVEYQWTEEGYRWINQLTPKAKASTR